jgi:5'-3' exonuclease
VAPPGSAKAATTEGLIGGQAPLAAAAARALGVTVWPSGRYQADELLSTAAARYTADPGVDQVVICATDNDFTQCVDGSRVVLLDRIRKRVVDEAAVLERFGVRPRQIPELFALIGDRSDGLPGVPGWGQTSAAAVLARYPTLEAIPPDAATWAVAVRGRDRLNASLREHWDEARLCRDLSVLRTDLPLHYEVGQLEWRGADRAKIDAVVAVIEDATAAERISRWAD